MSTPSNPPDKDAAIDVTTAANAAALATALNALSVTDGYNFWFAAGNIALFNGYSTPLGLEFTVLDTTGLTAAEVASALSALYETYPSFAFAINQYIALTDAAY